MKKLQHIPLKRTQANPLPVMEHFYSLQGEGSWAGTPAYFIRLAGCDVGCSWCDVKDSWVPREEQYMPVEELARKARASGAQRVIITGGEPTIYPLQLLTQALHRQGLIVHLETAGVHPLRGEIDWICFSPKKFRPPLEDYYRLAHELKVVIYNRHDFEWAEMHAARCEAHVQLFLQAEWSRRERFYPEIVQYIQQHPHWRMSMQTHKYLDIR